MSISHYVSHEAILMERRKWVEDLKEELAPIGLSNEEDIWVKQTIYRVPSRIKDEHINAYEPQMVSIGPYHHGKSNLMPMEHHKRRALVRFVERSKKSIQEYVAALEVVAEELMGAYEHLDEEWRNMERFLPLMLTDGCFLIEIMRGLGKSYAPLDPIFSFHGVLNAYPFILPDILSLENQIPLLVLARLLSVEGDKGAREGEMAINSIVFKLFFPGINPNPELELKFHMLDLYRRVLVDDPWARLPFTPKNEVGPPVRSVTELKNAGVVFRKSHVMRSVKDIIFENGVFTLPVFSVEPRTEMIYHNIIALEHLRPKTSHEVRTYMVFMFGLVKSAEDVALLRSYGLIQSTLGSDEAVAKVIKELANDALFDPTNRICAVRDALNEYYVKNMNKWSRRFRDWNRTLKLIYFSNPWAFISVLAAAFLLGLTVVQTYYSALSYYKTI